MVRIYFNRTYATNAHLIGLLRVNPDGSAVRVLGSHVDPDSPVLAACDEVYPEPPAAVTGRDYVEWALAFTAAHRVDVFSPRLELAAIAEARAEFEALGVALIAPPADAVRLFEDKAAAYADAAARGLPVPPHRVVTDADALLCGYAELVAEHGSACVKPVTGVGAEGFRVLTGQYTLRDLLGPLDPTVCVHTAAAALRGAADRGEQVPPLLMMPYLPGPEVSVDVLADPGGRVLAAVGRSKLDRRRLIVDDPPARAVAETLVGAHKLSYLTNTQVRYWQGPRDDEPRPYLLEVNTRPSAGLHQTALAGVNLAWSAVRLALGRDPQPIEPRYDVAYATVSSVAELTR